MRKNKKFNRIVAGVLALGIVAGAIGIGAYLTDTEVKKDVYTVGNVQAEIVAVGDMELDNVGALLPGTVHQYERAAMNTGINDAFVFMSLTIPYEMVGVSEDDGTQVGERVRQLFIPGVNGGYIGSEWKLVDVGYIGQYEIEDNGQYCGEHDQYSAVAGDTITYVYGYIGDNADGSLKALASGETTSNLVETMELTNLYHADKINGEISTKLYAIQSANVNGGLTDANGVWAVINKTLIGAENDATATLTYSISNSRTGDAVGYAPLKLVDENGDVVATSVANENGAGQFQNVPAGDYAIETAVGDLAVSGATGYAMRRVAANVTITTDSYVDLAFTAPSTTLIKGTELNALIPADVTSIVFTTGSAGAGAFDVSEAKDGSVMAWVDGTTMYVSAVDGGLIYANSDSSFMFRGKTALTSIDASNLDCSGSYNVQLMFYGCTGLSNVDIDAFDFDNFTTGASMFTNCGWLTEIVLPETLTSIDKYMFNNCQNLTSVVLPDGLTHIGFGAFQNCKSLTTITIPASVTVIEDQAFYGSGLTSVKFEGDQSQISLGNNWNYNTPMNPMVTNYRVTFQITDNNEWQETPTAYRVVLGDNAYSTSLTPGKSGYVNVPNGTYDVTVYAVFADGSESTSIQNVSSITVDNKAFSQKIILGELKNYNLTLNVLDVMNWGDKSVDHYQVILDNGASSIDVAAGQRPVVNIIEGSHQVEVIVHFTDGSSMSMKSNGTQSVSAINLTKDMTSTITLGYRTTVSITDNLNLGQSVTSYTVRVGNRSGNVSAGKSSTIYVGNGTYNITVIATLADKSTVDVTEYLDIKTVEVSGNTTLKLTLNGTPEVPETSGVTFAIVDNIDRGQSVNEYQVIINNKEYNAFATGATKVTKAIEIPNGTYTYYVCVILKDGSMQVVNDGFELIISGEGEYTIVLQN